LRPFGLSVQKPTSADFWAIGRRAFPQDTQPRF
jgi:hypothetical protein